MAGLDVKVYRVWAHSHLERNDWTCSLGYHCHRCKPLLVHRQAVALADRDALRPVATAEAGQASSGTRARCVPRARPCVPKSGVFLLLSRRTILVCPSRIVMSAYELGQHMRDGCRGGAHLPVARNTSNQAILIPGSFSGFDNQPRACRCPAAEDR